MVHDDGGADGERAVRTRRLQKVLFVVALLGIAGGTASGFVLARREARDDALARVDAAATAAGLSLESLVARSADALGGASAVVDPDGGFDTEAFTAFAQDLARDGLIDAVALIAVVDGADRADFEAEIGGPIQALGAGGALSPAPEADRYFPVAALPPGVDGFSVLGLDYLSDPVRGPAVEAAAATAASVVSGATILPRTGERGFVIVHPLFVGGDPADGSAVGFVSTGVDLPDLLESLAVTLPPGAELLLRDGTEPIAARGAPDGTYAVSVDVGVPGRAWYLTVDPGERPDELLARSVLAGGVVAGLWVLVVFITTLRYQRRMTRTNRSLARETARSSTLEVLGSRLSQSLSGAEVGRVLLERVPRLSGASASAVVVLSDDGVQLELVDAVGYDDGQLELLARVPLEGSLLADALATGEPAFLPSPLAWRDDPVAGRFADVGRAAAIVPLFADRPVGLLVLVQPNVRSFGEDERSLLATVGALAGRALDRSLRYDVDHATAVAFQEASLPAALPVAPGIAVAARYRPATRLASVGGDWYDVVRLDDGQAAVIVGDVVGHGVDAAAAMGQLRVAVRVLASLQSQPEPLLRLLGRQVPDISDAMCATMAYGVIDPDAGRFAYVLAGHPPPVLLPADGPAVLLDGAPWPPLGVAPPAEPGPHEIPLAIGDRLLLYTDGVVERRDETLTVGLERLRAAADALRDLPHDDFCDALLEAVVPSDDQADDVALLVVTRVAVEAEEPG